MLFRSAAVDHPEVQGLLALMLLHHARLPARTDDGGRLVPLADQDRGRWDTRLIIEGVAILQRALARDRIGEYQAQAAIAALHTSRQSQPSSPGSVRMPLRETAAALREHDDRAQFLAGIDLILAGIEASQEPDG